MTDTFGFNIKLLRVHWGYSQDALAEEFDTTRPAIVAYERGSVRTVPKAIVDKYVDKSGIKAEDLRTKRLDANKYPPKGSVNYSQSADYNSLSNISQNQSGGEQMSNDLLINCLQSLNFAQKQTIDTMNLLLVEKERIIEILKNK